jgi:hypothetical protein
MKMDYASAIGQCYSGQTYTFYPEGYGYLDAGWWVLKVSDYYGNPKETYVEVKDKAGTLIMSGYTAPDGTATFYLSTGLNIAVSVR